MIQEIVVPLQYESGQKMDKLAIYRKPIGEGEETQPREDTNRPVFASLTSSKQWPTYRDNYGQTCQSVKINMPMNG